MYHCDGSLEGFSVRRHKSPTDFRRQGHLIEKRIRVHSQDLVAKHGRPEVKVISPHNANCRHDKCEDRPDTMKPEA